MTDLIILALYSGLTVLTVHRGRRTEAIGRLKYGLQMLGYLLLPFAAYFLALLIIGLAGFGMHSLATVVLSLMVALVFLASWSIFMPRVVLGRVRGCGWRGRLAYISAIPLVNILFWIFLLFPSERTHASHGGQAS